MRFSIFSTLVISAFAVSAQTPASVKPATPAPAQKKAAAPAAGAPVQKKAAPAVAKSVAAAKPDPNDPVILTIGEEKVTKSQFEALVAALPEQTRTQLTGPNKRKFAEQYVELRTLAQEARRRKLDDTPAARTLLALQSLNVLAGELVKQLQANAKIDDTAVQSYFDQHKNEYEKVTARHILIRFKGSPVPAKEGQKELTEEEALAKAKELREKIVKGADFAEIAKAESADGSGANGGSLGSFGRGQMVAPFEQAAFSQPVGQVGEPVKSQFGYHIIKVDEHTSKKLEDVKPEIEKNLKPELARKAIEDVKKTIPNTISDEYFGAKQP